MCSEATKKTAADHNVCTTGIGRAVKPLSICRAQVCAVKAPDTIMLVAWAGQGSRRIEWRAETETDTNTDREGEREVN